MARLPLQFKVVAEEDDTPIMLAKQHNVDVGELVDFNQRRWYPELQPSSRLIGGTPVMIPTDSAVPGAKGIAATVSATNYVHWRVDYETGDQADLDEADVRRGFWHHRSALLPLRSNPFVAVLSEALRVGSDATPRAGRRHPATATATSGGASASRATRRRPRLPGRRAPSSSTRRWWATSRTGRRRTSTRCGT